MKKLKNLLLGAIAVGAFATQAMAEETVTLMSWGEYFDPEVFKEFEAETGIRVVEDPFDSSESMTTKLLVGGSGADVVVVSESLIPQFIKIDILQKLDKSKLGNLGNVDPAIAQQLTQVDPGNDYTLPYTWGTTGIGYNVAAVKERLGDQKIDSWSMLFDPATMAKLKDCGVYFLDSPQTVYPVALSYLGRDSNGKSTEDIAAAEALLDAVRPSIGNFKSVGYTNDLASGQACVAMGWSGDIANAGKRAQEAGNGVELAYVIPKEGSTIWIDTFVIPKDAPNAEAAHKFIDFLMRADIAARNSNFLRYPNGNKASFELLDAEIRNDPSLYPSADTYDRLFMAEMFTDDALRALNKSWTHVKTGQ